ncbi:MAG TPA: hypothetical protein PKI77_03170, partial [Mycobacterium sp.]|nr:hypothetical protein [Mycobacterium sp.]
SVDDAVDPGVHDSAKSVTKGASEASAVVMSAAAATATATGTDTSILGIVFGVVFSMITALEQWATGPATAPAGSTVSVRSSSLQLTDSLSVPADWYFPQATAPGQAPERIIFFGHGFFAVGAMYSYTAARLAENTNSIVVVPTFTSNFFVGDGLWINGPALQPVVADLFTGSRQALTASALAAGYAERYGLNAADAELPRAFALSGHSAGGSLVSGAAGYLVDKGAAADLVGVVLFDGVTTGNTVRDALTKLDSTGRFIPVREIGAPWNLWNSPSTVNGSLSTARPDRFTGVVLSGGTHADTIQSGGLLIQLALWILVGVPQQQNVLAMQDLADTWLNQWFDGQTGVGDNLVPGSTITIATPAGPATATVIGTPGAAIAAGREEELALAV